jgi:hypothetical protein
MPAPGAKIGMAVSAIIGGILAPNYGGRNTGVEMIEGIIKRDMAAQESDRSNKQWALGQRRSSIGEGPERRGRPGEPAGPGARGCVWRGD